MLNLLSKILYFCRINKAVIMSLYVNIELPCKPYVRNYIEQNYDVPVRFYRDKPLMSFIRLLLKKNNRVLDWRDINENVYSDVVRFQISENDMNRYGCELTNQAVMDLNKYFEKKAKEMMRTWIATQHSFGMPANVCVREFQKYFGYPEEIWKAESIYKDCQRNDVFRTGLNKQLIQQIHQIVLSQLSKNRTITTKGKTVYEED